MKIKRLAPSAERLVWARSRRLRRGRSSFRSYEAHRDYLLGLIRRRADMTLLEIQERLIANCGEHFSSSVLWRFLIAMRSLLKKSAHAENSFGRSDSGRWRMGVRPKRTIAKSSAGRSRPETTISSRARRPCADISTVDSSEIIRADRDRDGSSTLAPTWRKKPGWGSPSRGSGFDASAWR
jgi:hypothetical protein